MSGYLDEKELDRDDIAARYRRAYYLANREKIIKRVRARQIERSDEWKAQNKSYYTRNREKILERNKAWYQKNKEKMREYNKERKKKLTENREIQREIEKLISGNKVN